ncbi:uncharacterized protein [Anabrus simplex]|uniref:uncharacterized protein n=1 Tax=Anabrus simplex TaxID=316456 RepID=UPI0035A2C185
MSMVTMCFLGVLGLLVVLLPQEAVGDEDEEWPYKIIFTSCKTHLDPNFGRGKCSLKKPKGENFKRLNLHIDTFQEIFCAMQVTMSAKIKSNGNWVDNYNSEPKDYGNYYRQNEGLLEHIFSFGNFTACPMEPGRYEINNLLIDEKRFPKELDSGEYLLELKFQTPGTTTISLEIGAALDKI